MMLLDLAQIKKIFNPLSKRAVTFNAKF